MGTASTHSRLLAPLLFALSAAGCGDSGGGDLAPRDLATAPDVTMSPADLALSPRDLALSPPDLATRDLAAPADLARPPDLAAGPCVTAADCRLFDSYCQAAPCMCFALRKTEPDPPCNVGMVNCFKQPCAGHFPICVQGICMVGGP